eukprot:2857324-Rhodomonas_salina.2
MNARCVHWCAGQTPKPRSETPRIDSSGEGQGAKHPHPRALPSSIPDAGANNLAPLPAHWHALNCSEHPAAFDSAERVLERSYPSPPSVSVSAKRSRNCGRKLHPRDLRLPHPHVQQSSDC